MDEEDGPEQRWKSDEDKLDDALESGYIKNIEDALKPKTLRNCKSNALIKAMEVSCKLQEHANLKGPGESEFSSLAKKLDDFSMSLLDPLKMDEELRGAFTASRDAIVDKAIACGQKRLLSHPVISDMLILKWYGRFMTMKAGKWIHFKYWEWLVLKVLSILDVFLFPIIFLFSFVGHKVKRKPAGGQTLVFVRNASNCDMTQENLITQTTDYVHQKLRTREKIIVDFGDFEKHVKSKDTFAKKLFVTFTTNKKEVDELADIISRCPKAPGRGKQRYRPRIFPVALGLDTSLKKLRKIACKHDERAVIHCYEPEPTKERLGDDIAHRIEGHDTFESYCEFFTTPYFVFSRDLNMKFTLLCLHCYLCVTSPQVAISAVEWVILWFFVAKLASEARQLWTSKSDQRTSQLQDYFSDRWNIVDITVLIFYIVLCILRIITWAKSSDVTANDLLAITGDLYGLNAMLLTLRVFGHWMETSKAMGAIQIALFRIVWFLMPIMCQFFVVILAFSLALSKVYISDKSYANQDVEAEQSWWGTVKFLTWSLLGMPEKDYVTQVDGNASALAYFLYGLFLLLGAILLLNMMIALLSNTYQRVEDHSSLEWTYKLAITIQSYDDYDPLPVPFNLFYLGYLLLKRICGTCGNCATPREKASHEGTIITKLVDKYLATHGDELPSKHEKLALIKRELKDLRQSVTQMTFALRAIPACCQAWQSDGVMIRGSQLTYSSPEEPYHRARHILPFSCSFPKFEVLIQDTGEEGNLSVGLVWHRHELHNLLSADDQTWVYEADSGKIVARGLIGADVSVKAASVGDLISWEVLFDDATSRPSSVQFALNGVPMTLTTRMPPIENKAIFPYVSMGSAGIRVTAQMCPRSKMEESENNSASMWQYETSV